MAGPLTVAPIKLNDSNTDTNNFWIGPTTAGAMKLARGAAGSLADILTVDSSGNVSATTSFQQGGVAMPRMVLSTAQATTSGTSIDFTSIPSWVKRITVMLSGVSTNGTSTPILQIGDGSVVATGYLGAAGYSNASSTAVAQFTTGFGISNSWAATNVINGSVVLTLLGSNNWCCSGVLALSDTTNVFYTGGSKSLSGTLDRIRLTTSGGANTFDAGSVNLLYEG